MSGDGPDGRPGEEEEDDSSVTAPAMNTIASTAKM